MCVLPVTCWFLQSKFNAQNSILIWQTRANSSWWFYPENHLTMTAETGMLLALLAGGFNICPNSSQHQTTSCIYCMHIYDYI